MSLNPIEIEYSELASVPYKQSHYKVTLRVATTLATYEEDFSSLIIEVKTKLNQIVLPVLEIARQENEIKEKEKEEHKLKMLDTQARKIAEKLFKKEQREKELQQKEQNKKFQKRR